MSTLVERLRLPITVYYYPEDEGRLNEAADRIEALEAEVERLTKRIPDPDDLRMLANIAEWADEQHPERWDSQETAAAIASVRATLEDD